MKLNTETLTKKVREILNSSFWINEVKTNTMYSRLHDDHLETDEGRLGVICDCSGDICVGIDFRRNKSLKFRNIQGGGKSPRTRIALMILAEAIRLDNEELPYEPPPKKAAP
jgi:hypothetical protein